ncbi:MAG: YiiD C-terminal domain-containing protein [Pseudomonadales bacterium]
MQTEPAIFVDGARSLETVFHELIPISKQMGICVVSYDGQSLELAAPLAANVNHQQSAFGGSLFSIAALAGWGMIQLKLNEMHLDCNTVIGKGEVTYKRPVFDDFRCRCCLPESYPAFASALKESGKASISLEAVVSVDGKPAMTLTGQYVVTKRPGTNRDPR